MPMSIEIDIFHWTTGHRRNFATKSGGDKLFNRVGFAEVWWIGEGSHAKVLMWQK